MKNILRNSNFGFTKWCVALIAAGWMADSSGLSQTYYDMSSGNYSQPFTGINATWPANWSTVTVGTTGTIPAATKTTVSSANPTTVGSSTSIGQDAATSTKLVFLASGSTDNSASTACDLNLNFTGRSAGTLSFDYALIANTFVATGRAATIQVYYSTDGITWAALAGPYSLYNTTGSSTSNVSTGNIVLPSGLNNQPTVKFRFYVYNGGTVVGTPSGNRPKISIDNVAVTSTVAVVGTPPSLINSDSATVDSSFDVTFIDDSAWREAVTSITVNGTTLATAAYSRTTAGKITFNPSQSTLLQSAGNKSIVVQAAGYSNATVTQSISAGAATQMAVTTQPTAPSFNGGTLATQPVVTLRDQYGNTSTSTDNVTVIQGGGGSWALGGGLTAAAANGVATFTGLTAGHSTALSGVTLSFSSGSLEPVSSNPFNIPAPVAPTLAAASPATVDGPFTITFTENSAWRLAITAVRVASTTLDSSLYVVSEGQITLTPSASALLQTSGEKSISVTASGYAPATVTQTLGAGVATKLVLTTQPVAPATNGGALATQPIVKFADQYDNLTTSGTGDVTAVADGGGYTLGGNGTVTPATGVATFTDLTAGAATALSGVTISFSSGSLTGVSSSSFNIPAPLAPALAAAVSATVDADFVVTYSPNSNWQNAITGITVGGQALDPAAYFVADGQITFKPSASTLLQSANSKIIVVNATGYSATTVTQPLGAGVATKLAVTTQPTAPVTNGGVLAAQPVVRFQDQYNNNTSGTADVTAAPANGGTWTLGGTTTVTPASNIATFVGLTAANTGAALTEVAIQFSATGLQSATSNTFDIPPPPPANDLAENATTLPLDGTAVSGTMVQATVSAPFAGVTGTSINVPDVWYKFTPTSSGSIFLQANTSNSSLDLFVWPDALPAGTTGSITSLVAAQNQSLTTKKTTIFVTAGSTYYLRIALRSGNAAESFTVTATPNYAPALVAWDFFGEGTTSLPTTEAEVLAANLDALRTISRGAGAAWSNAGNSFRTTGFSNNGINASNTDYFEFKVSAATGYKVSLQNIVVKLAGTDTYLGTVANPGGVSMQFAYSLDGTNFTLIGSPSVTLDTGIPAIDVSSITDLQNVPADTTVTFRYYASGQSTGGGWGFNSPVAGQYGLYVTGTTAATSAPSDITLSLASIQENNSASAVVGDLSAADADVGDTFTYALVAGTGGDDNSSFNISGNQLRAAGSLDFEVKSSYTVLVQVTDSGGSTYSKPFTITVTNVNETPTDIGLTAISIAENNVVNAVVGTLSTTDVDSADTFTYELVVGTGDDNNASFNINGTSLRAGVAFDFETKSSYTVRVRTTDSGGATFETTFTITVANVVEGSTFAGAYPDKNMTDIAPNGLSYLANYGFGGSEGIAPTLPIMDSSDSTKLKLIVVVRTDDSISLGGETSTDLALAGSWSTSGVSVDPSTDASPVPANTARKVISVDRVSSEPKRFLRATITK